MKLGEKILSARKKAGLSQVDLADALGVSRQSVSKWETGEANPEIGKLPELARLLDVSTDWLLSEEDEPVRESRSSGFGPAPQINIDQKTYPDWLDHMPGFISKMAKKYGWLYGVYIAVGGGIFALFGLVSMLISRGFIFGGSGSSSPFGSNFGLSMGADPFADIKNKAWSGFSAIGWFTIILGLLIMTGGILLAVKLKKWGQKEKTENML